MKTFSKDIIIVIPIYRDHLTPNELISVKSAITSLANRQIVFVGPTLLDTNKISQQLNTSINFEGFDANYFKSTKTYNRLLISADFYERFREYLYLLICQPDVLVLRDDLDYWISKNYDNVGAPIFKGYSKPTKQMKLLGANGGFCLRKTESCINVLNCITLQYSKIIHLWKYEDSLKMKLIRLIRDGLIFNYKIKGVKPIINEDIFWSVLVPQRFSWFKTCDPKEAIYFSFDANPRYLYNISNNRLPMAVHAWWRYDMPFIEEFVFKKQEIIANA